MLLGSHLKDTPPLLTVCLLKVICCFSKQSLLFLLLIISHSLAALFGLEDFTVALRDLELESRIGFLALLEPLIAIHRL